MTKTIENNKFFGKFLIVVSNMVIGTAFLLLIAFLVPRIYWESVDTTQYYKIELPVETDKSSYVAGDLMYLEMHRTSQVTTGGNSIQELVLFRADGTKAKVDLVEEPTVLLSGQEDISVQVLLPADLAAGDYIWRGVITYSVHSIQKSFAWESERFSVSAK